MSVRIRIDETLLEDHSLVYDVTISGDGALTLHAVTQADAMRLADKIGDAIRAHTTEVSVITNFGEWINL